jgi:transposase
MPRPYPVELRERAVAASDAYGLLRASILFKVGEATLKRWRRRSRESGSLAPSPMGGDRRAGGRTAKAVSAAVDEKPDRILREVCSWLLTTWGRTLSISGVSRALRRAGLRRRAKALVATERSTEHALARRAEYLAAVGRLPVDRLIFLDESGCQRGMQRRLAWRRPGELAAAKSLRNRGTVTTVLGAISTRGCVAVMYGEGATTTEVFLAFLDQVLLPELRPGDVLVMDNLGAHQPDVVRRRLADAGVGLLFLPPYSPDLNPIEMAWSKLKTYVRSVAPESLPELHDAIGAGWATITASDACGWFRHCGLAALRAA